jgi:D-arabinose 1-dehydrogenase-like Zn-dependent alcohol dehydrogenase
MTEEPMKAVRLVGIGQDLELQEVPTPALDRDDVLVRIMAAGICHSDVHYRAGTSPVGALPQTLGHEIAGVIEKVGDSVRGVSAGDRVCLHYLVTCGNCHFCRTGNEQFCVQGQMLGKHCDGGFAEYIAVPARNALPLPPEVSFEHGAVAMCSSATSFHALRKADLKPGETVAVFGAGGLGMSAIQLAQALGAMEVYAVDISDDKLQLAESYGAIPVDAARADPVAAIHELTKGVGVNVALELIGLRQTMEQAVRCVSILGRAVIVGLSGGTFEIASYPDLLCKEAQVLGASDHLLWELPILIQFVRKGRLDLSTVVTQMIPLDPAAINEAMDSLERFGSAVRTVILP